MLIELSSSKNCFIDIYQVDYHFPIVHFFFLFFYFLFFFFCNYNQVIMWLVLSIIYCHVSLNTIIIYLVNNILLLFCFSQSLISKSFDFNKVRMWFLLLLGVTLICFELVIIWRNVHHQNMSLCSCLCLVSRRSLSSVVTKSPICRYLENRVS
mgnify:CR=1 FL=1